MPARNIKVAITDDHQMFRKGMVSLVKDIKGIKVVLEAGNGKELLAVLKHTPCDVVLMDIEMPEMDGIEATERVLSRYPDLKVLVMSQYDEQNLILHLVDKGAHGYLLKNADPEETEQAIRNVMTHGCHYNEILNKALFNRKKNKKQQKALKGKKVKLSVREQEVLQFVLKGLTTPKIAKKLFVSERTIESHRTALLQKTASGNTVELVTYAIRNGLVEPNGKLSMHLCTRPVPCSETSLKQ